jgi:hypothetical protein
VASFDFPWEGHNKFKYKLCENSFLQWSLPVESLPPSINENSAEIIENNLYD